MSRADRIASCPRSVLDVGEQAGVPTYGQILHLDELLNMQEILADRHDNLLFVVVHQVYELWFKVLLHELEAAREHTFADEIPDGLYCLRRVNAIERVLVHQVDIIETISPAGFLTIRSGLYSSSGFQSAQFREIEFLSGCKDPSYLSRVDVLPEERARLERRLGEPTLWDAFVALLRRRDVHDLVELYRHRSATSDVVRLAEALTDHDEWFALWRSRHVAMVERMIGNKAGTGGSAGADYLKSTLAKRFYPRLWELRSEL